MAAAAAAAGGRRRRRSRGDRDRGRRRTPARGTPARVPRRRGIPFIQDQEQGTKKVAPAKASKGAAFAAGAAAGAASGGGVGASAASVALRSRRWKLTSSGRSPGVLVALPAVAPPPLNMCLMPFAHALAELGHAVRRGAL